MKKAIFVAALTFSLGLLVLAQRADLLINLTGGQQAVLAVPDFRASGEAAAVSDTFNHTLWNDLDSAAVFKMAPKSLYPLSVPQRPEDFKPVAAGAQPGSGTWLTDWSSSPVNANYLAFGYLAPQAGRLVLFGYLYNVTQPDPANAHVIGKLYFGSMDEAGAQKVAHEFATDILAQFGQKSLAGSRIYFVSDRSGTKEIWSMDWDGSNQKAITHYNSISIGPEVSADGTKIAFTTYAYGNPGIVIYSLETGKRLLFYNQKASMNAHPSFTPDGSKVLFASTATGRSQIYIANADGSGIERVSDTRALEVEPKVNPKNGSDVVFVSDRSGVPQVYRMGILGTDAQRLSTGEGHAVNPGWHPDGQIIAFAWTRGYDPGSFNIFIMDVATRRYDQLTHGTGRNEHPSWAPDGKHLVFSSNRTGSSQIWVMRADGTNVRQVTFQGRNSAPVWGIQ